MAEDTQDAAKLQVLTVNFRRRLKQGSLSLAELEGISAGATAAMLDGTTVVEVTIEGGATRALVNCSPHIVAAAAEEIIAEADPANPLANTDQRHKYADFSGGRIET